MTRVLSGVVLLAIVIGAVVLAPAWALLLLVLVVLALALHEFVVLAGGSAGLLPEALALAAAGAAAVAVAWPGVRVEIPLLTALVAAGATAVGVGRPDDDVVRRVAVTLFPTLYLGLPLGALAAVRAQWGVPALLLLLATTVVSDTGQYYGGRMLGRRKLAPSISPKKTVEGAIAGVVAGGAVLPLGGGWALPAVPLAVLAGLGFAVVGAGIVGDLFESLLKRSAGVKDASGLIPGHGGMLDRIDSLLFAAPVYYAVLRTVS